MGRTSIAGVVALVLAAAAAVGLYLWDRGHPPALPPPPRTEAAPPAAPAAPAGPQHPLPAQAAPEKPLPALNSSDGDVRSALAAALGAGALQRLVFEDFIRRVVATVDNLPREEYAARLNPVVPAPGRPAVRGKGEELELAPENAARYGPYVAALESTSTDALVAFYTRHYPLFQQAYVELGYPQGYFNDRLVAVIDHLLAAPEAAGPVRLVQPKVLYEFADPDLEETSAGRKALVRIGPQNAARVKAKLGEIRARIAASRPATTPAR